jgi:hypothetical protein
MGRPRKVPLEGQSYAALMQGSEAERQAAKGASKTVTQAEIVKTERKYEDAFDANLLGEIAEAFKKSHPDKWEAIRLCPLQHGLEEMAACLNS